LNELALFAGAGGGILGGGLLGWRTVCAVEWEAYPASILCARQNDGLLPSFPIWDDVQTFDGKPWRGIVDVISGGFPCQDISVAGKGAGIEGERSGMWKQMARIIGEVRPRFVFVENSPMLTSRGLGTVLGDLSKMGFDAEWGVISAANIGANHQRERIWLVAYSSNHGLDRRSVRRINDKRNDSSQTKQNETWNAQRPSCLGNNIRGSKRKNLYNSNSENVERQWQKSIGVEQKLGNFGSSSWWSIEPNVGRVANGVAARVDRLKAIGNGQVPLCAATAWQLLRKRLDE
jgi:DNA (cytosine-5)-methyltransferase 1